MKRFIYTILLCALALISKAQDMAALFTNMPDQYIPQLENAWRKDLLDLYTSGKEARLKNTMDGFSSIQKLTSDYLLLQLTERSTVEIKMLPLVNNTHIICMITTIDAPVSDSRVEFFTTDWQPLNSADLFTPVTADWFWKENIDTKDEDYQYAASRLDMELIKYQLSPDNQNLTATYTTPLYLSKEERNKITPFLKETPKVYTWEKFQFK